MSSTIWTIGHSIKPIDEFTELLGTHKIHILVDVRSIPRSRHNPQFNQEILAESLKEIGLVYVHVADLGGLRKALQGSINTGWRNASFRGYADYMQSEHFWKALEELMVYGQKSPTAIMCAEAVPWRCHRSLIADALLVRGWDVRHIMSVQTAEAHALTAFATIDGTRLTYPKPTGPESPARLF
jgi:uncharacterized protein (DUF488 family)